MAYEDFMKLKCQCPQIKLYWQMITPRICISPMAAFMI